MRKLLRADFARLETDKVFWFTIAVMVLLIVLAALSTHRTSIELGIEPKSDGFFTGPFLFVGVALSVFCPTFIGTEYDTGTLRNKLVVGHRRSTVYMANFAVSAATGLLMSLANLLSACALCIPLLGVPQMPLGWLCIMILIGLLSTLALAALLAALSMLVSSRTASALVAVLAVASLLLFSGQLYGKLEEPEFIPSYEMTRTDESGPSASIQKMVPNPYYLRPAQREHLRLFLDALPTGQMVQTFLQDAPNPVRMMLCSLVVMLVSSAAGMFFFDRKEFK
ncbi:MAG: ABC transporter permease subunit [Eubacteriales bacterium]|nr:ABC transporter permease subunit [Christensenellaceae bacterium]MEA5065734.1 ABC transporter permease subunit [Eubacteriales bacterium]